MPTKKPNTDKPAKAVEAKKKPVVEEEPSPFAPFVKHKPKAHSTMVFGTYYEYAMELPFDNKKRMVRVWLPPEYDLFPNARFPVLYMADGQNLVDNELTAYGDWHLDRVIHDLVEEGMVPPILVGLDCPKVPLKRSNELNPPYAVRKVAKDFPNAPIGDQYVDFMADDIKPLIDKLFRTNPSREYTGIGGSSMGGIMSFYGVFYRKDVFGFAMSFSIPVFFYTRKDWKLLLDSLGDDPKTVGKIVTFVGGKGFEKHFTGGNIWLSKHLRSLGFGEDQFKFLLNVKLPHQEESWSVYSKEALPFLLSGLTLEEKK